MKRLSAVVLIALVIVVFSSGVSYASWPIIDVTAHGSTLSISVNGNPVDFAEQQAYITNGRTMVPISFVTDTLGARVIWDAKTRMVKIGADKMIAMYIDTRIAVREGEFIMLDAPPEMAGGQVMVPLSFVCEVMGAELTYTAKP